MFVDPENKANLTSGASIWLPVKNANWESPEGDGSNIADRDLHPVVHVSHEDARAYCVWMNNRLPTEAEWEYAAKAGEDDFTYPWGKEFQGNRMNIWEGNFPDDNDMADGYKGTSPVETYEPQNSIGVYDMMGNTWEWTNTRYFERVIPRDIQEEMYVQKGASYIDSIDGSHNLIARISNRMGQPPDYTAHNVGFRCARSAHHLYKGKTMKYLTKQGHVYLVSQRDLQRLIDPKDTEIRSIHQVGRRQHQEL